MLPTIKRKRGGKAKGFLLSKREKDKKKIVEIVERARKVLVLPLERELSDSTGTFWNNDEVIKRKLKLSVT